MAHGFALDGSWRALLADFGVRAEDVLRRAGLPDDLLQRESTRLDTPAFVRFCEAVAVEVNDPLLPLKFGQRLSTGAFSPPVFAALCSPNLEVAAQRLARFKPLVAPVEIGVTRDAGLTLTWRWLEPAFTPPWALLAADAVFLVELARVGTRHPVRPTRVALPVLPEPIGPYEDFLGVRLTRADVLTVSFLAADAARPFLTASQAMWDVFEPELRRRLADLEGAATFAQRARAVLLEALPSGSFAVDQVARRLGVSGRTLQRRLGDEGTSFQEVVRATREELALHYLQRTRLSSSEIAFLLGFEEPSSFFRAFHAWTGQTPEGARA
jgi:AraC-like DNA-binding protein